MSYTEMYKVDRDGNVHHAAEFHNSHRGAWLVWKQMCERYLHKDAVMLIMEPGNGGMQEVWDLWKAPRVLRQHRIVMASTFDRVMVRRDNLLRLIEAIEEYAKDFDPGTLLAQARKLQELVQDDDVIAVCWNQTSVNCNPWWVYDGDDELDEGRSYNVNADENHWFLFEGIDAQ